jgi:hypothetical protein
MEKLWCKGEAIVQMGCRGAAPDDKSVGVNARD